MFLKTSVSCLATPLTVSTRFGIRSARRCRATSTCDHWALTASRCVTSSLRTLTNLPPAATPITTSTSNKTSATFTTILLFLQPVDGVDHGRDSLEVAGQHGHRLHLTRLQPLFANIQQPLEGRAVEAETLLGGRYHIPLARGDRHAV